MGSIERHTTSREVFLDISKLQPTLCGVKTQTFYLQIWRESLTTFNLHFLKNHVILWAGVPLNATCNDFRSLRFPNFHYCLRILF